MNEMNIRPLILAICILFLISVNFGERKQSRFEVISMHDSIYVVRSEYLLPDHDAGDTVRVVLIQDGRIKKINKYVFVE
jgi:hypothetical protein